MSYYCDDRVGRNYLKKYVMNANAQTGAVTNAHSVCLPLLLDCMDGRKDRLVKRFSYIFPVSGTAEPYKRQTCGTMSEINLIRVSVGLEMVENTMKQATKGVRPEDILDVVEDLMVYGRMFQEWTIDACKKGFAVFIEYIGNLRNVTTMYLRHDDDTFFAGVLWTEQQRDKLEARLELQRAKGIEPTIIRRKVEGGVEVVFDYPRGEDYEDTLWTGEKVLVMNDPLNRIGCRMLESAADYAAGTASVTPGFPETTLSFIERKLRNDSDFAVLSYMLMDYSEYFTTITNFKNTCFESIRRHVFNKAQRKAEEKYIGSMVNRYVNGLVNEVHVARLLFERAVGHRFSDKYFALAAIAASFWKCTGSSPFERVSAATEIKSFADTILGAEFCSLMIDLMKKHGDDVPLFTEDRLETCTFGPGDIATFVHGEAYSADGKKHAVCSRNIEGDYLIRLIDDSTGCEEDGSSQIKDIRFHYAASRRLADQFIPVKPDMSKRMFISLKDRDVARNVSTFMEGVIAGNREVTLFREHKGGSVVHWVISGDLTPIKYRYTQIFKGFELPEYNALGEMPAKGEAGRMGYYNKVLGSIFDGVRGRVVDGNVGSSSTDGRDKDSMRIGFFLLEDVEMTDTRGLKVPEGSGARKLNGFVPLKTSVKDRLGFELV